MAVLRLNTNMFQEPYPNFENRAPFGSLDMDYRCELLWTLRLDYPIKNFLHFLWQNSVVKHGQITIGIFLNFCSIFWGKIQLAVMVK